MPVIYRYIKLALKISMPRLDHLFSGDEASSRRVEKKKKGWRRGRKGRWSLRLLAAFGGRDQMAQLHAELVGGGGLGGPELIALLLECVPMVPWQGRAFAPSLRLFPSPSFYAQR